MTTPADATRSGDEDTAANATAPAKTVSPVTVVAPKKSKSPYGQALNFIRSHGAPTRIGQLGRWTVAVCPMTIGLSTELDRLVSGRVVDDAQRVGAPWPRARARRCRPNVEIVFTAEPQKVMDFIAEKRGAYLGYHYASQTREFETVKYPIQAWYLTATRGAAGGASLDIAAGAANVQGSSLGAALNTSGVGGTPGGCAGSHFTQCLSSEFVNVLVLVDGNRVNGQTIGPVADYVAMLALAKVASIDDCADLPSILDLLSTKCGDRPKPRALTQTDIAYLAGLYSMDLKNLFWLQRDSVADRMTQDKSAAKAGASP